MSQIFRSSYLESTEIFLILSGPHIKIHVYIYYFLPLPPVNTFKYKQSSDPSIFFG